MEDSENKKSYIQEPDTVFSKVILSGKRIYYLDVKKNWKGESFLIITESKKVHSKDPSQPGVHFEKHKIFLNKEDFDRFLNALNETIDYAKDNDAQELIVPEDKESFIDPIHLKIDF